MHENIINIITSTINSIVNSLFSSIDTNIYSILDNITFINSQILKDTYFEKIFGTSSSNGILLISNSFLIGFVLYYSVKVILANFSITQVQSPLTFIVKAIIFGICMNSSFFICEQLLSLNSYISEGIQSIGKSLFNIDITFSSLLDKINSFITSEDSFNIFSFDGLIKTLSSISLFTLLFSYSLRYVMVKVFILISPFAFLSLINISTSWFFKAWFKSLFSLLILQSLIVIILLIIFSLSLNNSILSKLIYIGGIYALLRANSYLTSLIGGISTEVSANFSNLKNTLR